MSAELLLNVTPSETQRGHDWRNSSKEIHIERDIGAESVGNIYKGRVSRVL